MSKILQKLKNKQIWKFLLKNKGKYESYIAQESYKKN